MSGRVRVDYIGHVAHLRLSRPQRLNAIDSQLIDELLQAGQRLRTTPGLRAVVVSGDGRGFCSGLDLDAIRPGDDTAARPRIDIDRQIHGAANAAQHAVLQWRELPVPVIAAIHGFALGGGLQLPLGMDVRIVHPDTRMGLLEVKWGLIPDMAGVYLLRGLLRHDALAELMYSARQFDGREACALGICTRLSDDPLSTAMDLAQQIAANSPDAVRAAKQLLHLGEYPDAARILPAEAASQRALLGTPNQREAVAAGIGKRKPVFVDMPAQEQTP